MNWRLLWAYWFLWHNDICLKHFCEKVPFGTDPESMYFDCAMCAKEKENRYHANVKLAVTTIEEHRGVHHEDPVGNASEARRSDADEPRE